MTKRAVSRGAVHAVPADLRKVLISDPAARAKWEDITPLARNEWICWVISVKRPETRRQHIERVRTELKEGMRRPCCWPGCPHRWNEFLTCPVSRLYGQVDSNVGLTFVTCESTARQL